MMRTLRAFPEIGITLALILVVLAFSAALGLPFELPSGERAAFVGIHYLYPLVGVGIFGLFALVGQRNRRGATFLIALPCYAIVLVCHFNLKLWAPHIDPLLWDSTYWSIEQHIRPLVEGCMAVRKAIAPLVPLDSNMYMIAFIAMFYLSFCFHAVASPAKFRTLFLAALLFQALGALAYLIMPALGPFTFETGVEPLTTMSQKAMLGIYHENMAGGADWIARNGSVNITAGLAAMPSLHAGGSFLFLLFAWRYAKPLVPLYIGLFGFIAIDAVANRWHYVIDVPVGMALAWGCAWLAEGLTRASETPEPERAGGWRWPGLAALRLPRPVAAEADAGCRG